MDQKIILQLLFTHLIVWSWSVKIKADGVFVHKKGHIPKKLNAASATKLLEMFEKLVEYIKMNSERAKTSLLQSANIPFINNRIDKESKNQFLRERVILLILFLGNLKLFRISKIIENVDE